MKKNLLLPVFALLAVLPGIAARVDTVALATKFVQPSPVKATIIVPDKASTERCPTVYLLNGFGGDYRSWSIICPRLPELADCYGMVIVMPDGRDSWYYDSPVDGGMQMESFIVKELVPYVDANYPTVAEAGKRAITGLSMGGHGGLYLGIRHPDVWLTAGSTSGGVNIEPFTAKWKLAERLGPYEGNEEVWRANTVINMLDQIKPGMNVIFDCGTEDFFAGVTVDLHERMLAKGIPHDYISRPGTHCSAYWANSVLFQLLYFNEIFSRQ